MSDRTAIVVLGASGDLARRKLIPALAMLRTRGLIDGTTAVVGTGRSRFTDDEFRNRVRATPEFGEMLSYHTGMEGLRSFVEAKGPFARIVLFLALPPEAYASTAAELRARGFGNESAIIIEKPFGSDHASSRRLNADLGRLFDESQIFRIDHYLAKEAVQNILVFRFANSVFYPVWNSRYIESIQINATETLGVEERGAYFDKAGIIRDMVQNHLMQLLCLMTMEAPVTLEAEEIRAQKLSVLKAIKVEACCRRQYRGYREEKGVDPASTTETYAELRLSVNAFRWTGMPVYIRVGKGLDRKGTEIGVRFKSLPRLLFNADGSIPPNQIVFKIQPAEGIILDLSSKEPGEGIRISDTTMRFCYREAFAGEIPEAYQRLLVDAIRGDRTLFVSAEETELSWQKLGPVLDQGEVQSYERGALPPPCLNRDWIDFGRYQSVCA